MPKRRKRALSVITKGPGRPPSRALDGHLTREEAAASLGLSYSGFRGLQRAGAIDGVQIGGTWYYTRLAVERLRARREQGEFGPAQGRPVPALDDLEPTLIRAGLVLLSGGAGPLDLAIRLGLQARHVRALMGELVELRAMSTGPRCAQCDEQAAAICYECAAVVGGKTGEPAAS